MMTNMKEIQEDYGRDVSDKITLIDDKGKSKATDNKDCISEVFWDQTWLNEVEAEAEESEDKPLFFWTNKHSISAMKFFYYFFLTLFNLYSPLFFYLNKKYR